MLAAIWLEQEKRRNDITRASNEIDRRLKHSPWDFGESRETKAERLAFSRRFQ